MEEAGGGQVRFSPSWRRDELRRLRRLRRRFCADPLLGRLPPGDGSPTARPSVVLMEPMLKGERTHLRHKARPDRSSQLSFWRRIVGVVIAVAVTLLLMWITLSECIYFKKLSSGKTTLKSVQPSPTQSWLPLHRDPPKLLQLEPCPDDWLYYKKKCYYHSGTTADWNSSQKSCSAYGASLAVIDSHQELDFIMYRIRTIDFWIGLRRKGNKFFWVNGESFDTNLFHVNITNDGDCVHIDSAFISTRRCSSQRNWLCTIGQFNPRQALNREQLAV